MSLKVEPFSTVYLPLDHVHQAKADPGHVGYQEGHERQDEGEGPAGLENLPERYPGNGCGDEQDRGHRWGLLADPEVDRDDDAEVNRVHADLPDKRPNVRLNRGWLGRRVRPEVSALLPLRPQLALAKT